MLDDRLSIMKNWKSLLRNDPTDWLLESDNPSVRYFTLTDILEKLENDFEVIDAKKSIMGTGTVPKILEKQKEEGYWINPKDFYIRTKYKGTVWTFLVLAELGADKTDDRIRKTCKFILEHSQDKKSGGFAYYSKKDGGGDPAKILPCLTGNMVWCLIRFGYLEDPRVQQGIKWITTYQRFDDGIKNAPKGWPYDKFEKCYGKHTCHMGVVKSLKALAEIPPKKRSAEIKRTIEKAAEFILKHHIFKRSQDLTQVAMPKWLKFGFPLMWNTDILEILSILTKLGYKDERMQESLDVVIAKQNEEGKWVLEQKFSGRMQANIERKGKPSKWITLNALRVLKGN